MRPDLPRLPQGAAEGARGALKPGSVRLRTRTRISTAGGNSGAPPGILVNMRSIGFDVPRDPMAGSALRLAGVLTGLEQALADRGMTGRELLAVCFDHRLGKVDLVTRCQPLETDYPGLSSVLMQIARTCVQDAIAFTQFRRIVFEENQVTFELVDAWGVPQVYVYSIRSETPTDPPG